jgi:hypothetical protein
MIALDQSEIILRFGSSKMRHEIGKLNEWLKANHRNKNSNKTKESIILNTKTDFSSSL